MASFGPPTTLTQPTQTHPIYPNCPAPIPVTQNLPSQAGASSRPFLMAGTTPGGGPSTRGWDDRGRGWLPPGCTLPLVQGSRRGGYGGRYLSVHAP